MIPTPSRASLEDVAEVVIPADGQPVAEVLALLVARGALVTDRRTPVLTGE